MELATEISHRDGNAQFARPNNPLAWLCIRIAIGSRSGYAGADARFAAGNYDQLFGGNGSVHVHDSSAHAKMASIDRGIPRGYRDGSGLPHNRRHHRKDISVPLCNGDWLRDYLRIQRADSKFPGYWMVVRSGS